MGDLIEISTIPQEKSVFYKVSTGGLKFDVKGANGAIIGLSKTLDTHNDDTECDYWVVLGYNNRSYIYFKSHEETEVANTQNLLSSEEYRSFWLLWNSRRICVGRAGESEPFLSLRNVVKQLNFVTFAVKDIRGPINWRFELAPEISRPEMKMFSGGEPRWVNVGNQLSHGAVVGGYEDGTLYIIRARHEGSLTPGKFVPSEGVGYIPWGSAAHEKEDFEVLVGYNYVWVPTYENRIPVGAVLGGFTEYNIREKLYIGRAKVGDHIIPGKVQPSHRVCYVPYNGRECAHRKYEILVSLDVNRRCHNKLYYSLEDQHNYNPARVMDSDEE